MVVETNGDKRKWWEIVKDSPPEKLYEVHNVSITPSRTIAGDYDVECSCHEFTESYTTRNAARLAAHKHIIDKLQPTNGEELK